MAHASRLGQKKERLNNGDNNGQATHGARKHAWRTQAAWAKMKGTTQANRLEEVEVLVENIFGQGSRFTSLDGEEIEKSVKVQRRIKVKRNVQKRNYFLNFNRLNLTDIGSSIFIAYSGLSLLAVILIFKLQP